MIFGKLAQELIRVPAQQLATAVNSNRFILPHIIKNILGETYIFQVSIDSRKFNMNIQSFKVTKFFQTNMTTQIKIEEKEASKQDNGERNTQRTPQESQNELVNITSSSKVIETA